jgi:hypothetical protein
MMRSTCNIAGLVAALFLALALALAQITAGTVTGRVVDPSGAIVAGARLDVISQTQGTKTAAIITNATGGYTLEVSAPSFKIIRRQIAAYTKSGANQIHRSGYGLFTRWNWNKNSWTNRENGAPQAKTKTSIHGYSLGGPVYIAKIINGNKASRSHILGPRKCEFGSPDPGRSGEEKA